MDGYSDVSTVGYAGRMDVIEGRGGRRLRSEAERARIAAESLAPGARVAEVARRHDATRWQADDWRRKLAAGALTVPGDAMSEPAFAALVVETPATAPPRKRGAPRTAARIELVVACVTVRVSADVDEEQLTRVIRAIRAATE